MSSDFEQRLLETFNAEAREHLDGISSGLVQLEQDPDLDRQAALVETMFRQAHSLKGAARSVGALGIAAVCQPLEEMFARLKRRQLSPASPLLDVMLKTAHELRKLLAASPRQALDSPAVVELTRALTPWVASQSSPPSEHTSKATDSGTPATAVTAPEPSSPRIGGTVLPETVRIATHKLDSILFEAEDLVTARLTTQQRLQDLQQLTGRLGDWRKHWARVRPRLRSGHGSRSNGGTPMNEQAAFASLTDFLNWNAGFVQSLAAELSRISGQAARDQDDLGARVESLLDSTKEALMLPFSQLLEVLPVMVREMAREQGKEATLQISGEEIAVDRRILEELRDAFVHLIRNSIDHGIEPPQQRARQHKPPRGSIDIKVAQVAPGQIQVVVADDGAGMDLQALRKAAASSGISKPDEAALGTFELAFESGVSTSPAVTEISGRGLGLAIVREKVEKLGGTISIDSEPGKGTRFRLVLPNTLARFRGILVNAAGSLFMVPTLSVDRVTRVGPAEAKCVENRETIQVEGQTVLLVKLAELLQVDSGDQLRAAARRTGAAVILGRSQRKLAVLVDEILYEEDVLMKSLGPQLQRVAGVAGATVLGNGKVVPVLNVSDLLKMAASARGPERLPAAAPAARPQPNTVLVAEDSFTSRSLLKHILQSAGYRVETAVNGADALALLKRGTFDLLVSDVDMPKLNGFDLTAAVRHDPALGQLPVVLVTALASPEDQARGMEVGANAYVVKSSFDQSNLLQVVANLVH